MKKLLSLLMLLCLALTVAPAALAEEVVNVYNWEDYIAPEVLTLFTEETGIKVNYMCFTTNEDMIVQVEANPGAFDVCFPSDYIIERMIAKDLLAEINYDNVPNFDQIIDKLRNPDYDPENKYSVPYMWGTVGILYNKDMIPEPNQSWSILWDTQYQKNVFMLDSYRDSMGITLKYLGYSMNSREVPELMAAKDKLIEQKKSGVVKAYQVDETKDKMVAGEAALALMWSGDAQYAIDLNDHLDYFVPTEGSNIWVDGAVILNTSDLTGSYERYAAAPCDVLKVAHHGSRDSSGEEFLAFVSPKLALISCSSTSRSLPGAETLERLAAQNIPVLRTDQSGDVTLFVENGRLQVRPYRLRSLPGGIE